MKFIKNISDGVQKQTLKTVVKGMNSASDKNLIRLMSALEVVSPKDFKSIVKGVKESIKKDDPFIKLIKRVLNDLDENCKDKILMNLVGQGFLINQKRRDEIEKKHSYTPTSILISPTMRCNLNCVGCYAAKYSKKDDMSYELFDRIVTEAEEMGVTLITVLGGEPLVYPHLFKIFKKHKDMYFQFFTNSTLITDKVIKQLKEVGNAAPMISIEGWEKETDERRGKGTYKKILKAMKKLKKAGIPFGVSAAVTSKNTEIVSSDKFMKFLIDNGAYFCWWFLYMPIGAEPDLSLMPTPKQRKHLYERRKKIRAKWPIFLIDFWNDAPYVGGCIAGKQYVHINSKGDVEPCIFTHFAADNIKDKSLMEVMQSDYFKALRAKQPFNDNLYMPCMWIDNPEIARDMHKKYGVYPTHKDAEQIIKDKKIMEGLDKYAKEVEEEFGVAWEKDKIEFCENCNNKCNK